ncbi:acyl-[acyl-carrier-protein]--UDP-N-acetylglucosamine O-acyltransferase [Betaproteobacteria bacterium]|nr:acyl-[acyl-carrier-protein]--UDP-N-acetylglucosamine O-acyltransferase [Betaproteobacteria bacterium]GHT99429.1 acyl-[acyl-carrier-protein]--UDP-N-acetylglucosamine O-acyltransferase [Betaproteobacteria bacterium]GHU24351.1 acyl-[acyl-carrier-protein]--UDP-N-acetylglucosamine O-acyltransferase [Betaproteobacteria bacterium]
MIHPSAIVHPGAKLGKDVAVGPYSIIGEHVEVGAGTRIGPHVVIEGHTRIGSGNEIFQFCSIGAQPQDKKYEGEPTRLEIGDHNTFRECCTVNVGTRQGGGLTRVGSDNWMMAYVHVAHDCVVGDHAIFANNATLAGHVQVGDWAILGGFTGVHQFVRVGAHSFCGVGTVLLQDLPPYVTVAGNPARPHGINSEGLRRRDFSAAAISAIKQAYRTLYRSALTLDEAREKISASALEHAEVQPLSDFIGASGRGLVR